MALDKGDPAPDFRFTDRDGSLQNFHGVSGTRIVFFFPQAFTPGCTAQACSLRDNYNNLKQEGVTEVFGISIDSEEKIEKFKREHDLDYIMVADTDGSISKKYDVYNNFLLKKISGRVTYTVDGDHKISHAINSGIMGNKADNKLSNHANDILDILKF